MRFITCDMALIFRQRVVAVAGHVANSSSENIIMRIIVMLLRVWSLAATFRFTIIAHSLTR